MQDLPKAPAVPSQHAFTPLICKTFQVKVATSTCCYKCPLKFSALTTHNLFVSASSRTSFTHTFFNKARHLCSSDHKKSTQKMKLFFATLLLCSLLLSSSFLEPAMAQSGFCSTKCKNRCAKAAVQDRCMKYCGICCQQCKCVPSGTYGNKHECACYRDKRNAKGKPKCP